MKAEQQGVATALSRGPSGDFRELACRYLDEYLSKIQECLAYLDEEALWRRDRPHSNSVGNLLLHLRGNLGLWILHGLGGEDDRRRRSLEFTVRGTANREELARDLTRTVGRCQEVLRALPDSVLQQSRRVQGYEVDGLGIAFHAVEHMSYHTGQIVWMTKAWSARGDELDFYPQHRGE